MVAVKHPGVHDQNRNVREMGLQRLQQDVNPHKWKHLANARQQQDIAGIVGLVIDALYEVGIAR